MTAGLFDLDGVLTETAGIHRQARERPSTRSSPTAGSTPSTTTTYGYEQYVDARTRDDGVRAVLASRDLTLPTGSPRTVTARARTVTSSREIFRIGGSKILRWSDADQVTLVGAGVTLHACVEAAEERPCRQ